MSSSLAAGELIRVLKCYLLDTVLLPPEAGVKVEEEEESLPQVPPDEGGRGVAASPYRIHLGLAKAYFEFAQEFAGIMPNLRPDGANHGGSGLGAKVCWLHFKIMRSYFEDPGEHTSFYIQCCLDSWEAFANSRCSYRVLFDNASLVLHGLKNSSRSVQDVS